MSNRNKCHFAIFRVHADCNLFGSVRFYTFGQQAKPNKTWIILKRAWTFITYTWKYVINHLPCIHDERKWYSIFVIAKSSYTKIPHDIESATYIFYSTRVVVVLWNSMCTLCYGGKSNGYKYINIDARIYDYHFADTLKHKNYRLINFLRSCVREVRWKVSRHRLIGLSNGMCRISYKPVHQPLVIKLLDQKIYFDMFHLKYWIKG